MSQRDEKTRGQLTKREKVVISEEPNVGEHSLLGADYRSPNLTPSKDGHMWTGETTSAAGTCKWLHGVVGGKARVMLVCARPGDEFGWGIEAMEE